MDAASSTQSGPRVPTGLGYALRAAACMTGLMVLYYFPYDPSGSVGRSLQEYLTLQARLSGWLIGIFDPSVRVEGTSIDGAYSLLIVKTCSALDLQALYAGAVLTFPARARFKALGLALGLAALNLLNLTRVALLYLVGAHSPARFDEVHEEWMPLLLVACTCGLFMLWLRGSARVR
ncbi:MAG: archaeosortase/exosortase family protein [Myxococcales bacterium]